MSCNCQKSPCTCEPECDPENEPLSSALDNFVAAFFGSISKTCVNGQVSWVLPCDLDEGIPGFPRIQGEGVACYLLRFGQTSMLLGGPAGGTLGGTYPNPTIATGGSGDFTPGSVIFAGATGGLAEDNANVFFDDANNHLGIGTSTPNYPLEVYGDSTGPIARFVNTDGTPTITMSDRDTDGARKLGILTVDHFTNAEETLGLILGDSTGTVNSVLIGGGRNTVNAATLIEFYTATTTTTITGTRRMVINSDGKIGIGTTAPTSLLEVSGAIATPISTKVVAYPVLESDSVILADATVAPVTITLPTPVGIAGRQYTVKKIDATANLVTIATAGGTIDGAATKTTAVQYIFFSFVSDGSNWFIV